MNRYSCVHVRVSVTIDALYSAIQVPTCAVALDSLAFVIFGAVIGAEDHLFADNAQVTGMVVNGGPSHMRRPHERYPPSGVGR